ncbi:MAG: pyruvate kinase [Candidatus Dojkabacteria bacterium]|nr:MAG: pyruvate kinase [Candidatus Dojkabacteria bacterium]
MTLKTKIVCTIGPASWDPEVMRQMIENGMNVARVNGAFADTDELDMVRALVRNVSDSASLMVDVKGPEIRLNKFDEPIPLKVGETFVIGNTSRDKIYPANYKDVYTYVKPGQRIVIGDGDVEFVVEKIIDDQMYCTVQYGEVLKPGKAMNLPNCDYTTDILTEKDKENLQHAIKTGWEFVSASFVQDADSARKIKEFIGDAPMKLIAKIENQAGIDNIDEILEVVDGVMIARGGLGVELGLEKVPYIQKLLIDKCNRLGKIVITATQMLESMTTLPRPTRAEVNDVATAVFQGTDAVMLSAESSAGKFPIGAVAMLHSISTQSEDHVVPQIIQSDIPYAETADALTKAIAAMCMSNDKISKVVIVSKTGTTPRLLARHRIKQDIFAYVSNSFYRNTLMLTKGITQAFVFDGVTRDSDFSRDAAVSLLLEQGKRDNVLQSGETVLIVGKTPMSGEEYFPNIFEIVTVS